MDSINERRSIRKYSSRRVLKDIIYQVLEAAGWALLAHNAQPWRLIVLTGASLKRKLAEAMSDAWVADMVKEGVPYETRESMSHVSAKRFTNAQCS